MKSTDPMENWFRDLKIDLASETLGPPTGRSSQKVINVKPGSTEVPPNAEVALLWAGIRPWVMSALRDEELQRHDFHGDEDARGIRRRLAEAIDKLPILPEYDLPLGYGVGDQAHFEIRISTGHPAWEAAFDHADEFSARETHDLVRYAANFVTAMPIHGLKLRRSSTRSTTRRTSLPLAVRTDVLHRDNYTCQYCGRRPPAVELQVDHRVPVSQGGTDEMSNLVTACTDCNLGKSDRFST